MERSISVTQIRSHLIELSASAACVMMATNQSGYLSISRYMSYIKIQPPYSRYGHIDQNCFLLPAINMFISAVKLDF